MNFIVALIEKVKNIATEKQDTGISREVVIINGKEV